MRDEGFHSLRITHYASPAFTLTIRRIYIKITPFSGEVAQRWSSGLISHWLWVRIPPSPHKKPACMAGFDYLEGAVAATPVAPPLLWRRHKIGQNGDFPPLLTQFLSQDLPKWQVLRLNGLLSPTSDKTRFWMKNQNSNVLANKVFRRVHSSQHRFFQVRATSPCERTYLFVSFKLFAKRRSAAELEAASALVQ